MDGSEAADGRGAVATDNFCLGIPCISICTLSLLIVFLYHLMSGLIYHKELEVFTLQQLLAFEETGMNA